MGLEGLARAVDAVLASLGTDVVVVSRTPGAYHTQTGDTPVSEVSAEVKAGVEPKTMLVEDRRARVLAFTVAADALPFVPKEDDQVEFEGRRLRVFQADPVYASEAVAAWQLVAAR